MRLLIKDQSGFTLLETVLSVAMIALLIPGLFLTWELAETRSRGLDQYAQVKDELETAYEIIARTLRGQAISSSVSVTHGGQGISFTMADGSTMSYTRSHGDLMETRNTSQRILLRNSCEDVRFSVNGKKVHIEVKGITPSAWKGETDDLTVTGYVYMRN